MNHVRIPFFHREFPCLPFLLGPVYLLVCFLLLVGVSFCRYTTGAGDSDQARAAAWEVEVAYQPGNASLELSGTANGTATVEFSFKVVNHSETALRYDLQIRLDTALPAGVTMQLDSKELTPAGENLYTVSNAGTLAAESAVSQQHTLSFTGDFSTITPGTNQSIPITITVQAEQID
nr:hypothetical protein [uncultured Gemmiger sp.]